MGEARFLQNIDYCPPRFTVTCIPHWIQIFMQVGGFSHEVISFRSMLIINKKDIFLYKQVDLLSEWFMSLIVGKF